MKGILLLESVPIQTGYLRKVLVQTGNQVLTEPATLAQAFPNAQLNLSMSFANEDALVASERTLFTSEQEILKIDRKIEHQFAEGVKSVMQFEMNSDFNLTLDLQILNAEIQQFSSIVKADYSAQAQLEVDLQYEYDREFSRSFNPLFEKNQLLFIGQVPLLVNVKLVPMAQANVKLSSAGSFKYGYKVGGAIQAGFRYQQENFTQVAEFTPTFAKIGPVYSLQGGPMLKL